MTPLSPAVLHGSQTARKNCAEAPVGTGTLTLKLPPVRVFVDTEFQVARSGEDWMT